MLRQNRRGATALEYGLLAALACTLIMSSFSAMGRSLDNALSIIANAPSTIISAAPTS